jgi:outer membrane protein assembly factor BamE (lipoprotein component of BamABCDE complex)
MKSLKLLPALLLLTACAKVKNHGKYVDPQEFSAVESRLKAGPIKAEEAFKILGTPNFMSESDSNNFYYIFRTTQYKAFFKPKTLTQQIVKLQLTDKNIGSDSCKVTSIAMIKGGFNDSVPFEAEQTLSPTNERNLAANYFYNFGRFKQREQKR